jgi:hypothetical protein
LDFFTLKDGTDKLSRNFGKDLPLYTAQHPSTAHTSSASPRWPEIMHNFRLHNTREISWLFEKLLASKEDIYPVEFVT